jgi:hypothetical protein
MSDRNEIDEGILGPTGRGRNPSAGPKRGRTLQADGPSRLCQIAAEPVPGETDHYV